MAQSPIGASAGLSSASREPSMEEILASIRRIIEESDTIRPDEVPPLAVNSDVPAVSPSNAHLDDSLDDEEAELAPRQGIAITPPVQKIAEPMFPPHLPDLDSKPVEEEMPETEAPAEAIAPEPETLAVEELRVAEQIAEKPEAYSKPETAAYAGFNEPKSEPEAVSTVKSAEPVASEYEATAEEAAPREIIQTSEPILSESTVREVSAAFDDLSFAVRSGPRRSFDEIAQETMRPMLQDWLDNNLPTLVERLVREEIERVVRGDKR